MVTNIRIVNFVKFLQKEQMVTKPTQYCRHVKTKNTMY